MLYELLGKARTVLEADNGRQSKKLEWMEWMDTPKTVMTTRAPANKKPILPTFTTLKQINYIITY